MGLYANILPYANAILMVIKEIAKAIAKLFGIDTRDYNSGLSSTEEIYDGISTGAGNAAKATKELKRQLLKFDEVNNITTPKSSGSGSGAGGVSGGIDKRLLDAIKGYDNLMEQVQMKATRIRNAIMEWLGFTEETNEETGETYFKFKKLTAGTVLGALGVGGIIYKGLTTVVKLFTKLTGLKFLTITSVFGKQGILATGITKILGFVNPITLMIAGIGAGLVVLYNKSDEFRKKVDDFFAILKRDFKPFIEGFLDTAGKLLNGVKEIASNLYNNVLKPLGELFLSVLEPVASAILDILKELWVDVIEPLSPVLKWIADTAIAKITKATNVLIGVIKEVISFVKGLWDNAFKPVIKFISDGINTVINTVGKVIEKIKDALRWLGILDDKQKSVGGGGKGAFGGGGSGGSRALGGVFNGTSWKNLPQYANGGMPSHGTAFIAGENGAEIVGNINRRTEVLNRSQIASAIYSAVASAMSQFNGGTSQIDVHVHTDEGTVVDRINQKTKQTGRCPIDMPAY